jgi:hypothetical protein
MRAPLQAAAAAARGRAPRTAPRSGAAAHSPRATAAPHATTAAAAAHRALTDDGASRRRAALLLHGATVTDVSAADARARVAMR